jgi:acid phosphatase
MNLKISAVALGAALAGVGVATAQEGLTKIKTIVVIYAENRSFDHLYGYFPGADGIANATVEQKTQVDHDGTPLPYLTIFRPNGTTDPQFPRMPNAPFPVEAPPISMQADMVALSPIHAFFHNQEQINGGKNNMFAAISNVGGWAMGYFDGSQLRMWQWAKDYTLADNFFMCENQHSSCRTLSGERLNSSPWASQVRVDGTVGLLARSR